MGYAVLALLGLLVFIAGLLLGGEGSRAASISSVVAGLLLVLSAINAARQGIWVAALASLVLAGIICGVTFGWI